MQTSSLCLGVCCFEQALSRLSGGTELLASMALGVSLQHAQFDEQHAHQPPTNIMELMPCTM